MASLAAWSASVTGEPPSLGVAEALPYRDGALFQVRVTRAFKELLEARKGYREGETLRTVIAAGAAHNEAAWGRRLKKAVPFLLGS